MRRGPAVIAGMMLLVGCSRGGIVADGEPGADGRPDAGPPLPRPTRVDLLVVVTVGYDSLGVYQELTGAAGTLVDQLIEPNDGRPVRDLHLGAVTSKVDIRYYCASKPDTVPNDGTLLVHPYTSTRPPFYYPASLPWPPPWPFLTYELAVQLPELTWDYVGGAADATTVAEGECSVTQFLESAALAVDQEAKYAPLAGSC